MSDEIKNLMNLKQGSSLICVSNPTEGVELNNVYTFLAYDESNIPKNDYSATMTWYPSKPIWTPENYEDIRFKFMMAKLHGVEKPVWLKDFRRFEFTE